MPQPARWRAGAFCCQDGPFCFVGILELASASWVRCNLDGRSGNGKETSSGDTGHKGRLSEPRRNNRAGKGSSAVELAQKYELALEALKSYVAKAGFTDVVLGLSGGIDSSLTATMCVEAFGAQHVHGFMLPGPYSTDHSLIDAEDLARNLGIETQVISILEPYRGFEAALESALGGSLSGLASENTQARCRMVSLMAISNARNWLLINTGNKSEACMGFSTLYGDTAGAFAPLGGFYKTDVFALSRWVNQRAIEQGSVAPIPEHVLVKPPSAELSPDAKDEEVMGIEYDVLDRILIAHYEQGLSIDEVAAQGFDAEQVAYVVKRTDGFAFKRAMEPPFPEAHFYA